MIGRMHGSRAPNSANPMPLISLLLCDDLAARVGGRHRNLGFRSGIAASDCQLLREPIKDRSDCLVERVCPPGRVSDE